MSGLVRNLLTIICALFAPRRADAQSLVSCHFLITPLDCGISVLKSDKYLQLAEAAQIDFLIQTKLIGKLMREGINFVNAAQLVKFMRPVRVFRRVRIQTSILYADDKCTYFSHSLFLGRHQHGEVLVKMKFKKNSMTINPAVIASKLPSVKPEHLTAWDLTLEAMP